MIVINARFLTQKITGVQRYAYEICKRLPEKINGHEIIFLVPKISLINELDSNCKLLAVGSFKGNLWEQIDLPLYLKKIGNPLLINFVGIAPILYKHKIMFLYDLAFKHHPEWFSYKFYKTYNMLIPISLKNAFLVITDSHYVKNDINKTYNIHLDQIEVVYGASSEIFYFKDLPKEKFVLTVSSIDPRKNLRRVIEAFNQLKSDYKLVIVGSKNKTFSNSNIPESILNEKIVFTGYLDDSSLVELYNKSDVFVYASLFEGFGIPPLEAQSCGCPCLISNTTSLPEVYGNSVTYCDPYSVESIKDNLSKMILDKQKKEILQELGFINAKKYNWQYSTNKFVEILKCILERKYKH